MRGGGIVNPSVTRKLVTNASIPLAVPEKRFGLPPILALFDRCASLASLHPPPAALGDAAPYTGEPLKSQPPHDFFS